MTQITVKIDAGDLIPAIRELAAAIAGRMTQIPNVSLEAVMPEPILFAPPIVPAFVPAPAPTQPAIEAPAAPVSAPGPVTAVPTAAPVYTLDQLAVAATPLIDGGRQQELVALLGQFGVQALTQLTKDQYGAFATGLRQLGAKI